ncbi:MAG: hypothetical protein DRO11_06670 [Methanobacteriota archaeon]|nr:MAG: hypothetical protein DRO11_06670 [Euryarchaeota archaeon]
MCGGEVQEVLPIIISLTYNQFLVVTAISIVLAVVGFSVAAWLWGKVLVMRRERVKLGATVKQLMRELEEMRTQAQIVEEDNVIVWEKLDRLNREIDKMHDLVTGAKALISTIVLKHPQIDALRQCFVDGRISLETYKQIKQELEKDIEATIYYNYYGDARYAPSEDEGLRQELMRITKKLLDGEISESHYHELRRKIIEREKEKARIQAKKFAVETS